MGTIRSLSSALRASLTRLRREPSITKKKIPSGTQGTHFVKSRAHSPRATNKIVSMIALRRAILMKADPEVSRHAISWFSGRA